MLMLRFNGLRVRCEPLRWVEAMMGVALRLLILLVLIAVVVRILGVPRLRRRHWAAVVEEMASEIKQGPFIAWRRSHVTCAAPAGDFAPSRLRSASRT